MSTKSGQDETARGALKSRMPTATTTAARTVVASMPPQAIPRRIGTRPQGAIM